MTLWIWRITTTATTLTTTIPTNTTTAAAVVAAAATTPTYADCYAVSYWKILVRTVNSCIMQLPAIMMIIIIYDAMDNDAGKANRR